MKRTEIITLVMLLSASSAYAAEACSTTLIVPSAAQIQVHYVPDDHMAQVCGLTELTAGGGVGIGNCAGQLGSRPGVWQIYLAASFNKAQRADTLAYEMKHLAADFCSDWQR